MNDNPYESPQTVTPLDVDDKNAQFEPRPPLASEVFNAPLSFRTFAEYTDKMVLTGRIALAVLTTVIVLAGISWLFYKPQQNPIWVTVLMLNCGAIASVLIVWRIFEANTACDYLQSKLPESPDRQLLLRNTRSIGSEFCAFFVCIPLFFQVVRDGDIKLLFLPLILFNIAILAQAYCHTQVIHFLRSFVTNIVWKPAKKKLQRWRLCATFLSLIFLVVMSLQIYFGSTPWPWLILSLTSLSFSLIPSVAAYRQLALEFDKRWP